MSAYRTSAAGGATAGTGDRTVTITTLAGDLILVFASMSGNTNTSPTCSDNQGGAYTLVASGLRNVSADSFSVFVGNALVGTGASTVITVATGSNTAGSLVAVAVSGMDRVGLSAIRQSAKQENQASGGTPAPAFSAVALTENMTLGMVSNGSNPTTMTPPTSWTEQQDVGQANPTTGCEVVTRDSGFTGTTITWGGTSGSAFGSAIVELNGSKSGTVSESGSVSESQTVTLGAAASDPESGSASESASGQLDTTASIPESGAGSESQDGVRSYTPAITESLRQSA